MQQTHLGQAHLDVWICPPGQVVEVRTLTLKMGMTSYFHPSSFLCHHNKSESIFLLHFQCVT